MNKTNALEGLRGTAAVLVVAFHMYLATHGQWFGLARNGYLAVDLFFVLSGFVICAAYSRKLDRIAETRVFILRRFGRLFPVFAVTTALYYAVSIGVASILIHNGHSAPIDIPTPAEFLALATMTQALNTFDHSVGNGSAWSACDEFYVYLVFAATCFAARAKARIFAFAGLAMAGYGIAIWAAVGLGKCLSVGDCFDSTIRFGWSRCLAGFFAGALIAEFRHREIFRALRGGFAQVATFTVVVAFFIYSNRIPGLPCAAPLMFVPLVASLIEDHGPIAAVFCMRPFQFLGRISYSLYLTHAVFCLPFVSVVNARDTFGGRIAACLGFVFVCVAIARIMCEAVEIPCRARIYEWSTRSSGISTGRASTASRTD
ncbi:acyltransferase [Burkholderia sp. Ac-20353]|uniref:acyltransferase family protein n=1 Tax=Burkholderia sp. Ac-20353 TaxID=2703894 RepID=UPI00197B757F|nr:acyltransferase [Burkholderia sp. Ac-20353]MBN3788947.1 acyltransferase [Burkholderia sp. Ac-20353]